MTSPCWSSTFEDRPTPSSRGSLQLGLDPALLLTTCGTCAPRQGLTDASWAGLSPPAPRIVDS